MSKHNTFIDRLWKDKNGNQTLLEKPNAPLIGWAFFGLISLALPDGSWRRAAQIISFGFLFTWAWLEIHSGRTYLRRVLGVVIMVMIIYNRIHNF